MKNIPEEIYLQIGDEVPNDCNFEELQEVTWNKEKIYKNDIPYVRATPNHIKKRGWLITNPDGSKGIALDEPPFRDSMERYGKDYEDVHFWSLPSENRISLDNMEDSDMPEVFRDHQWKDSPIQVEIEITIK